MRLAARGLRDLDGGAEPVRDAAERAAVARQARRVHVRALLTALAVTIVYLILT